MVDRPCWLLRAALPLLCGCAWQVLGQNAFSGCKAGLRSAAPSSSELLVCDPLLYGGAQHTEVGSGNWCSKFRVRLRVQVLSSANLASHSMPGQTADWGGWTHTSGSM